MIFGGESARRSLSADATALLALACSKASPPPPRPAASASSAKSAEAAHSVVVATSAAPITNLGPGVAPREPPPAVLDAEGQRVARAYLSALGKGRKATLAKDYAAADAQFSRCLELLPKDPRALAERGYARLLANQLSEARADLITAGQKAPNAALQQQIFHNLVLVAQRLGDSAAAERWQTAKDELAAARRLPSGTRCSSEVSRDELLEPVVVSSFESALDTIVRAHAAAESIEPGAVQLAAPFQDDEFQARLSALKTARPIADGASVIWSCGRENFENHAIIARSGKLYVYPSLSSGQVPLCGLDGLAEVTIEGGGTTPWRIERAYRSLARGYRCVNPDGTTGDACDSDVPTMGFCNWGGSEIDVTVLDAQTFRGVRRIRAEARPSDDGGAEPARLLDLDWQSDHVNIEACGQRQQVPYVDP